MKGKRILLPCFLAGLFCLYAVFFGGRIVQASSQHIGEDEFKEYCAECHVDGGNVIKPDKSLSKRDREQNGVKTVEDIIKIMRNPGEGMNTFDEKTVTEKVARKIAEYIIATY